VIKMKAVRCDTVAVGG